MMKKVGLSWFMISVLYFISPPSNLMTTGNWINYFLGIAGVALFCFLDSEK